MPLRLEPLPLLIGLSGKRDLGGSEPSLIASLESIFSRLDEAFPNSLKILVSGLAEGADMVATKLAIARGWGALALLPMAQEYYANTLSSDATREQFDLILRSSNVLKRELAPLALPHAGQWPPVLEGRSETSLHYEQLAIWLAEYTHVLIAALPADEQSDKLGGTVRAVRHRLTVQPDAVAIAVIDASRELAVRELLDPLESQAVWRIDLPAEPDTKGALPVAIQLPGKIPQVRGPFGRSQLRHLFPLAADIDIFNMRIGAPTKRDFSDPVPNASELMVSYRRSLSRTQAACQQRWKQSIRGLAASFLVALLLLESYAKLPEEFPLVSVIHLHLWAMAAYLVTVGGGIATFVIAQHFRWQLIHEDYRAVNEMLRVQHVWWQAGLVSPCDRADHFYLQGAVGSLARVRRGAGAMITWARLFGQSPAERWTAIYGSEKSYVEDQIEYFQHRSTARERAVYVANVVSWFCFSLAFGIAAWLAFYAAGFATRLANLSQALAAHVGCALVPLLWVLASIVLIGRLLSPTSKCAFLQTTIPGFLSGATIAFGMYELGSATAPKLAPAGKIVVILTMVMLLGAAGTIRFVAEKFSWGAEARTYREAQARFTLAKHLLQREDELMPPSPQSLLWKRRIIHELGIKALSENESWLRTHREHPLEPVLGG